MVVIKGLLRFEDIIEVDADGDTVFSGPHLYVSFVENRPPFSGSVATLTVPAISKEIEGGRYERITEPREFILPDKAKDRIEIFPKRFRRAQNSD